MCAGQRRAACWITVAMVAAGFVVSHADTLGDPGRPGWVRTERGAVTVVYRPGEQQPALRILDIASSSNRGISSAVGLSQPVSLTIYVAATSNDFRTLTMGGAPDWGAGCAFPKRGVIVLRSPAELPNPLHTEDVVAHEIAHVAAAHVLGEFTTPRWFDEGIAMLLAGEWRLPGGPGAPPGPVPPKAIPLSELRAGFPEGASDAMLAYLESYYAVSYLMDRSDANTPAGLLEAVRSAGGFDEAVAFIYGKPLADFENDVVRSFAERFGWRFLLTRWDVLFLFLSLFVLLAAVFGARRSRERLRRWEERESEERRAGRLVQPRNSGWQ
jgi:hypothetical protein